MQSDQQKKVAARTGKKTGIWLAFSFALGFHFILLFLPITSQMPVPESSRESIELQLTTFSPQPETLLPPVPEPEEPLAKPPPLAEFTAEPPKVVHEEQSVPVPVPIEPPAATTGFVVRNPPPELDNLSKPQRRQLTNTILMRQFITEESAVEQLFGRSLVQNNTEIQKEFHYPLKQNMKSMLDQPLPDLPFAYTPDLVYFAYEPGVKGDLQRFWDVITPEFGWRTRYGTEVRCILVLVLVGCGWK